MNAIIDRLEGMDGLRKILVSDVQGFKIQLSRGAPIEINSKEAGSRRAYVRAVFALIEALVEQHKRLLLDLAARGLIVLDVGAMNELKEEQRRYLRLREKLEKVYQAAGIAFGQCVKIKDANPDGWESVMRAIAIRNRITHPKDYLECNIQEWELDDVDGADLWFREVNNEFVRMAKDHRKTGRW